MGMTKQEKYESFDRLFPYKQQRIQVLQLWESCKNPPSGIAQKELFVQKAKAEGYSQERIEAFKARIIEQIELWFFKPNETPPSPEDRAAVVDPQNPNNPFCKFVGNEHAVRRLCRAAFAALGRHNHACGDQSFALLGPASTGKTTLAKMFAQLVGLPFVEIDSQSCQSINDIAVKIAKVCESIAAPTEDDPTATLELASLKNSNKMTLPPIIVFIDEVHNLPKKVEQGLLKATEQKDSKMLTELGWEINTEAVCWIIATTDRGALFDAFDTRFTKIHLNLYTLDEIAQIIKLNHLDWQIEACEIAAKYGGRIPREALAFAHEMDLEAEMPNSAEYWDDIAEQVAKDNHIDSHGMTYQRVAILTALGQGPIAKANLGAVAACKEAELTKFIMPPLLAATPDQRPLVKVTTKGYCITNEGLAELDKRRISYAAEYMPLADRLRRNNLN